MIGFMGSLYAGQIDDYSQACVEGDIKACYQLGAAYRDGDGVRQDAIASKQFFEIACDQGNAKACSELNNKEQNHNDFNMNTQETENNTLMKYRDACDRGDGSACYELGLLYDTGKEANIEKANQLFMRSCELNDMHGCVAIASAMEAYNRSKAMEYYSKICERTGAMCDYIAISYESGGDGLDKDLEKAKKYYQIDCTFGKKDSCQKVEEISYMLSFSRSYSSPNQTDSHKKKVNTVTQYTNERFGFTLSYPANQFVIKNLSDNGDGITLYNADRSLELRAYGSWYGDNIREVYYEELGWAKDAGQKVTYKVLKKNWFVLSGIDRKKQTIFYKKTYFRAGKSTSFRLEYLIRDKEKYNSLVSAISKNFKTE